MATRKIWQGDILWYAYYLYKNTKIATQINNKTQTKMAEKIDSEFGGNCSDTKLNRLINYNGTQQQRPTMLSLKPKKIINIFFSDDVLKAKPGTPEEKFEFLIDELKSKRNVDCSEFYSEGASFEDTLYKMVEVGLNRTWEEANETADTVSMPTQYVDDSKETIQNSSESIKYNTINLNSPTGQEVPGSDMEDPTPISASDATAFLLGGPVGFILKKIFS